MSLQSKMMSFRGKIEKIFSNRVLIGAFGLVVLSGLVFGVVKWARASSENDTATIYAGWGISYGEQENGSPYGTTTFSVKNETTGETYEATCAQPLLKTPGTTPATIYDPLNFGYSEDTINQIKRVLLVSNSSYDSKIYDAFHAETGNMYFWDRLASHDSAVYEANDYDVYSYTMGHIIVSKLYTGRYDFVSSYESYLDEALASINTWFESNYPDLSRYKVYVAELNSDAGGNNYQEVIWVEAPDVELAKVRLVKTDGSTGSKLDGAKFTFYKRGSSNAYADRDTSYAEITGIGTGTANGGEGAGFTRYIEDLEMDGSRYCFIETSEPLGYNLNETPVCTKALTEANYPKHVVKLSMKDTPKTIVEPVFGKIKIQKQDAETGNTPQGEASLVGAVFSVLDSSENEVDTITIEESDGVYVGEATDLLEGTYTIKEKTAGVGYLLNDEWVGTCTISTTNESCEFTGSNSVKNQVIKAGFSIEKVDSQDGHAMAGVQFHLYAGKYTSATEPRGVSPMDIEIITDSEGKYTLPESKYLPYGRYTLYEVEGTANAGYTMLRRAFWMGKHGNRTIRALDQFKNVPNESSEFTTSLKEATTSSSKVGVSSDVDLVDTITFTSGHKPLSGRTYRFKYELYGQAAGSTTWNKINSASGATSMQTGAEIGDGTTISFNNVDTSDFAGGKLSVVITLQAWISNVWTDIYQHNEDHTEASEMVTVDDPVYGLSSQACKIGTSGTTCDKSVPVGETGVVDTVDVTQGLISGREYIVRATAVCYTDGQTSGTTLKTADSDSFSSTDGKKTGILIELEFDSSSCTGGKKIGVQNQLFEYSGGSVSGAALVQHNQGLNDSKQTVSILTPSIVTTASPSGDSATVELGTEVTVNDTINYSGLAKGTNYCLAGKLMRGSTVLAENTKAFKASDESGNQTMSFKFNSTELGGESVTVNEYLYQGACGTGTLIVTHENGSGQTVLIESRDPAISTTASPSSVPLSSSATVNDTISYSGLIGGVQYCLAGKLMDGTTAVKTADKIFTPSAASGRETVSFTFDSSAYEGKSLTVNEYLYKGACSTGELVVTHENGTGQTVTVMEKVPTIGTKASNNGGATNILEPAAGQVIVDKVKYYNLKAGQKYTLFGDLMKSATEKFSSATSGVRVVFTATERDGEVNMTFPAIDATNLAGQSLVVFERLYLGEITSESGTPVAKHEDFSDGDQAVVVKPKVGTKVAESQTLEAKVGIGNAVIIDTIEYEGLVSGQTYIAKGWLVDANGRKIEGSEGTKTFKIGDTETPETSGKVKVSLPLRTVGLGGKKVVAFEEVYLGSTLVAVHKDVNDQGQTLDVLDPALGTEVKDSVDGDKEVAMSSEAKVVDTVSYKGLVIGSKYCVRGVMMDKETGNPVTVEDGANVGNIEGKACFTADRVDGSATVEFAFDASKYGGKTFVVFETLYLVETQDGKEVETSIAKHHNIEDAAQTFTVKLDVPETGRVTSDNSGAKVAAGGVAVIIIGALGYGVYLKRSKRKYSAEA